MTAHELIAEIYARPQPGMASNLRRITERQMKWLRDLIGQDEEGGAVESGMNGGLIWMPSGRWKYVLSVDPYGERRTIARLTSGTATAAGKLFD